jgi:drug/metabolite transporter (DMT)-like permease
MSKANRLVMLAVLCFATGAALFLTGSSGPGIPLTAIVLVVGALALVGSLVFRRREPRLPPAGGDLPPAAPGPSRAGTIGAVAGAAIGAIALLLTLFVAQGEARSHGFFHMIFGVVVVGLFVAVDRWWRPREGTAAASLRTPLMVLLWVALAAAFLESIGAAGYDRFNSGQRIPLLTSLHGVATALGALGLLMIPIAIAVLASAFVGRLRSRKTATS